MSDRIPFETPSEAETAQVRAAIERNKAKANARDKASQPKPASDDVSVP